MAELTFGEKLKKMRELKGLTQTELADRIGIKQPMIVRYEQNTLDCSIRIAQSLAKALGCELKDLI